jgi:hypothetical protein
VHSVQLLFAGVVPIKRQTLGAGKQLSVNFHSDQQADTHQNRGHYEIEIETGKRE